MDHTSCRLRLAAIADAPAILEIYAQYMDTPITFETELPSLEECTIFFFCFLNKSGLLWHYNQHGILFVN